MGEQVAQWPAHSVAGETRSQIGLGHDDSEANLLRFLGGDLLLRLIGHILQELVDFRRGKRPGRGRRRRKLLHQRLCLGVIQLTWARRSEEHTSELQSHLNLVCRLLLEKKKLAVLMYTDAAGF